MVGLAGRAVLAAGPEGINGDLGRPARRSRHERGHRVAGEQEAWPGDLGLELVAVQAPSGGPVMITSGAELRSCKRGHKGQCVDLAVRVVQRDPDLLALVLEDEDIRNLRARAKRLIAIGPDIDQQAHPFDRQLREGRRVL